MLILPLTPADMPAWAALSAQYDEFVRALVGDLRQWYEGNDDSPAFTLYMQAKISQREAFMACDSRQACAGIVAFSRHHNRITFLGISRDADLIPTGTALLRHAFTQLNPDLPIAINLIASPAPWIGQHRQLLTGLGFVNSGDAHENGVPVVGYTREVRGK